MIHNFLEWLEDRRSLVNEENGAEDPFMSIPQKQGDFAYFGVHDLAKYYKQTGQLPGELDPQMIMSKMGQIVDADPVNMSVTIYSEQDPFHFGYRKLENRTQRSKRKKKMERMEDKTVQVNLPTAYLQDITHMMGGGAGLNGHRLWLVVDARTQFQQALMREIRKKEAQKSQGLNPPVPPMDSPDQTQYSMTNREVFPTQQGDNPFDDIPNLDVAHHDLSFMSPDRLWKRHTDIKIYEYYQR